MRFWQRAYEVGLSRRGVALPAYRAGDREPSWLYTLTLGAGLEYRLTSARRAPWFLSMQLDAARTRYRPIRGGPAGGFFRPILPMPIGQTTPGVWLSWLHENQQRRKKRS